MSKFVIIIALVVIAAVNARGIGGDNNEIKNEIAPLEKEGRFLFEVPLIGSIILTSLKVIWFLLTTVCSVVDYKLAGLALLVNAGIWAFSFKFPVLVGAAVVFGFCKLTGLCSFNTSHSLEEYDHLAHAAEYLDMGTLKYGKSS